MVVRSNPQYSCGLAVSVYLYSDLPVNGIQLLRQDVMQLGPILGIIAVIVVVAVWWYWRRQVGSAYIDFLSRRRAEQQKKQHGPGYYQPGPPQSEDEPETKRKATDLFGERTEAEPPKSGSTAQPPSVSPVTPPPSATPPAPPILTPAPEAI